MSQISCTNINTALDTILPPLGGHAASWRCKRVKAHVNARTYCKAIDQANKKHFLTMTAYSNRFVTSFVFNLHMSKTSQASTPIPSTSTTPCHNIRYLENRRCQVTSKILGIGTDSRSLGAVKHLKTDKWAHHSREKDQQAGHSLHYCVH